jgi:hypothetical protein
LKDRSQPALGSLMYYALFPSAAITPNQLSGNFAAYLQQNYKIAMGGPAPLGGGCERFSDVAALRANSMDMLQKQWASSKTEAINTNWTGSPAESAAAAAATPATAVTTQSSSAPSATFFISCSTARDGGIDTYYTDVFQEIGTAVRSPNGAWGSASSQSVLDHFYAYLTQKGYNFKPGSSSACDVRPTEAEAKAAHHKRAYEGGGCSTCGKVVETGWKDTP